MECLSQVSAPRPKLLLICTGDSWKRGELVSARTCGNRRNHAMSGKNSVEEQLFKSLELV